MAEHTPAPWTAEISDDIALVIVRGPDGEVIVSDDNNLSDANAHLIAAAPEMLAALRQSRRIFQELADAYALHVPFVGEIENLALAALSAIDAAIAKAEGKS